MKNKTLRAQLALLPFALIVLLLVAGLQECNGQTDSTEIQLLRYKSMYEKGLINEAEYSKLKESMLGIRPVIQREVIMLKESHDTFGMSSNELYEAGKKDAYKRFRVGGVFGGTFVTTIFCSPVIGLIPAIACSSSAPKEDNFINDKPELFKNPDYLRGYRTEAKKQKRHSAWSAWGAGTGLSVAAGIVTGILVGQKKYNK